MFDSLSDRFDAVFSKLRNQGRLREGDVDAALVEIRTALLEADVAVEVARSFTDKLKGKLTGLETSKAISPEQQVVKAVHEELVEALGGDGLKITYASKPPTVVLLAGLQGSGKTTAIGKLARWFKSQGRNPLVVGADLQRPGAVEQLRLLAGQVGVAMFSEASDPVSVAKQAMMVARNTGRDVVLVDTAGRLSVDEELMEEVRQISKAVEPNYTFLVVDAMLGQDAVGVAKAFHETLELDGIILSKLDGDARGGAALSVKGVVGKPIVFASVGEKLNEFEPFYPDRMAQRILGMGDILTLIEKAEANYDREVAERAAEKIFGEGTFGLDDFLEQLLQLRKMGPLSGLMGMLPGVPKEIKNQEIDEGELNRVEAIIRSMTPSERANPDSINGGRRLRIANGSGVSTSEVNLLLKQFKEVQKMMKSLGRIPGMKGKGKGKGRRGLSMPPGFPDVSQLQGLEGLGGKTSGGQFDVEKAFKK